MSEAVLRFAPSPTGFLHLGHAASARFGMDQAISLGARHLLRIEDLDIQRCRPEFEAAIYEDLAWLGIIWESPVRRQSDHPAYYAAGLQRLRDMGVLYPCFCSRKDIAAAHARLDKVPTGPDGPLYPGTCRDLARQVARDRLAADERHSWRIDVARAQAITGPLVWHDMTMGDQIARPALTGDMVLGRKDMPASYHLAVVMDDALQGITHVTRGHDLFHATHLHRLLQALLGLPVPVWHHHGLVMDPATGQKLSKRDASTAIRDLRASGHDPAHIMQMAAI